MRWLLLAPLLLTACDGASDDALTDGTYILEQVAGRELPAARVDKSSVCDERPNRDHYTAIEAHSGGLDVSGERVTFTFEQRTQCENTGRASSTDSLTVAGTLSGGQVSYDEGSLRDVRENGDRITATLVGFDGWTANWCSAAPCRTRRSTASGPAPPSSTSTPPMRRASRLRSRASSSCGAATTWS